MLTRLYIDNFRCFVNFEHRPARKELILGANGCGKSSFIDVLLLLRQFVSKGVAFDETSVSSQRTRWMNVPAQTFELDAALGGSHYRYRLVLESQGGPPRTAAKAETVQCDGKPLFSFVDGAVILADEIGMYEVEPRRSALATAVIRDPRLIRFKQWLDAIVCFRLNPFAMKAVGGEEYYPASDLSNIAAWYRHLVQFDPEQNEALLKSLRESIDGFSFLQLEPAGENIRLLVAKFERNLRFTFAELSEGQRCLIGLYTILHFLLAKGATVVVDEPDNFISLREIQPWLMGVTDLVEQGMGQMLIISHHPEIINQWAPGSGVRFFRESAGPVRVEPFRSDSDSFLTAAEVVARGWDSKRAAPRR